MKVLFTFVIGSLVSALPAWASYYAATIAQTNTGPIMLWWCLASVTAAGVAVVFFLGTITATADA